MANTFKNNYVDLTTAYADAVASADVTGEGIGSWPHSLMIKIKP